MLSVPAVLINLLSRSSTRISPSIKNTTITMDSRKKPTVLFVLGGPGSGKGTQCTNLQNNESHFVHLSAGDLLRAERNSGSKDGELIQHYIKEGKIVPVEITVRLIEKAMNQYTDRMFLVDGFPRNENNLQGWDDYMKDKANVKGVLYFDCPEEICVKRILERAKTSGRVDDNEESLRKRFRTFYDETMPIIEHFQKKNLVLSVNAIPEPDEVYENVKAHVKNL